ncbi:guanylate kinase, partial [Candidatus Acetothermia bacterium]
GKDVILNIDVNGARTLRARGLLRFTVSYGFLAPSSVSRLEERLRARGTEDEVEIARRLEVAARELEEIPGVDYLVINDEFDRAVDELAGIITAERVRIVRR